MSLFLLIQLEVVIVTFSDLSAKLAHIFHYPAERFVDIRSAFQVYLSHEFLNLLASGHRFATEAALRSLIVEPGSLSKRSIELNERATGGQ